MEDRRDDTQQDDDPYRCPGTVAVLYLDEPSGTLTPEETAFLLGNDRELIMTLMLSDEEQGEQWTADALAARQGTPDPVLVEASGGKSGLAESCLHEARAWATSAQAKRAALAFLDMHPRPVTACPVVDEFAIVQNFAERLAALRRSCDAECQAWPDACHHHGEALTRRENVLAEAVESMRAAMIRKLAEQNARLSGSPEVDPPR